MAIDISLDELNLRVSFFLRSRSIHVHHSDFDFCLNSITFGNVCFIIFDCTFRFIRVEYCIWESVRAIHCVYSYHSKLEIVNDYNVRFGDNVLVIFDNLLVL